MRILTVIVIVIDDHRGGLLLGDLMSTEGGNRRAQFVTVQTVKVHDDDGVSVLQLHFLEWE